MPRTLLIVDDIKLNREILKNILGNEYVIQEASHGKEAIAIMNRDYDRLSVVLLDLRMPVMDGFEVLRYMKENQVLSQLPVIVMTGQVDSDTEEQALKLGAKDYISKPYKPAIIKQRIWNTINLRETAATINALRRDQLTGLFSRQAFFDLVSTMVERQAPGYYIMACFDVERFKMINDLYGTQKGDMVLRYIAKVFNDGFVEQGGICCRISADDFAVLYPASFQNSPKLEVIHQKASFVDGLVAPIAFSIGRYVVDDKSLSPSAMYDRAMMASESIKGRYDVHVARYDESLRSHILQVQQIVTEMKKALTERQFEVWYQPQYNHSSGALIGAEALVRWRHPQKGLISPGIFIPIFENNGFIYQLDKYVWEDACRFLRRELDEGEAPLPISVNISRSDLLCPDIVDVIKGLVERFCIPVELLRLEITESAFAESTKVIVSVAKQLIHYGFTVEIDDFGSGYSSLNTLKSVPAQVVKLDMRFFEDDDDSQRSGNIIESIVRMTKWLGMSVIAEGVEMIEQADYLRSIGCNYIQGFLYARPMPEGEYREMSRVTKREEKLIVLETVENLNNNAFWDPKSMDTLIFNSYVGGACIFEYRKGKIELLRATEKYAQLIGGAGMSIADALRLDWTEHLDADSAQKVTANLKESIESHKEVIDEYIFLDLPGCAHETYLRSSVRVIASVGDRYLVYCTNENITAQRQSEKREQEVIARLRMIMANVKGAICATMRAENGEMSILFANDRYYNMLGYAKSEYETEYRGTPMRIVPEDYDMVMRRSHAVNDTGKPDSIEYRIIRKDGMLRWLRSDITAMDYPGVNLPVQLTVSYDITEQLEYEKKIRSLSEQMQAIMDTVDLGIIAAVVEGDKARYLFMNDFYFQMLGYTKAEFEQEVHSPYDTVHPEDRPRIMQETARINYIGASTVLEYRAVTKDGRIRHIRSAISIGRLSSVDGLAQLSILRDITEETETARRERTAAEQMQAIMRDVFSGISATVLDEEGNIELLFSNEQFFEIRGYTRAQYEAEVKDKYALIHPDDREKAKADTIRAYTTQKSAQLEYRILCRDGSLRWLKVGLSSTRFTGIAQNVHICVFTDITAQKRVQQQLRDTSEQLQSMMDDMPGGFVRMRVTADGSISPIYFNKGFYKLTGMDYDTLMSIYQNNALAGVHPDDIPIVKDVIDRMFKNGEAHSTRYRIQHGSGGYVWLRIFGRVTKDAAGNALLNVYYNDATEQMKEEEHQKEILDNLPGGSALYEYRDGEFVVIHINKRYWQLVGRPPIGITMISPLSAVHPDDVMIIRREMESAIRQNRDVSCDIRLRYETNEYRSFHIAARIVPKEENVYSVYASFTPICKEMISYQQMLPLLLSAMMESTTDLSFAKDCDLHYLSASRAFARMTGASDVSEIIGKTDYDLFDKALADKFRIDDMAMFASGKPMIDIVEPIPAVDGVPHYSSTSKYLLHDADGEVIGIYGLGRDITKTVVQDTQLRLVNDSIPGGLASYVCTAGPFSAEHIRIVYFNDGFCRMFGYSREEYEYHAAINPVALVVEKDRNILAEQWRLLMENGTPINCLCRTYVKDGGYKWISYKAVVADRQNDRVIINTLLQDVTDQRELIEQLRISEEESNLAVQLGGNIVCRYIIADKSLSMSPVIAASFGLQEVIYDVPEGPIRSGMISHESVDAYRGFFEAIQRGSVACNVIFRQKYLDEWRWMEGKSSTIFSDEGIPVKAVISMHDVTERLEKENVYKKWQQSLDDKKPESYTLFRCNLNNVSAYSLTSGSLMAFDFENAGSDFNERAKEYARKCIVEEDRDSYIAFANSEILFAGYYRGNRSGMLEYREKLQGGGDRWIRLTVDLVEYPNSTEVEAYLMYEDIDDAKRYEMQTKELAENDPLTGIYNRVSFIDKVDEIIHASKPETRSALLMLDIDGFKQVNDVFGHGVGDQALVDIACSLRDMMRRDDLVGRIGGDEFVVFLSDVQDETAILNKALQICAVTRKSFSLEVRITGSIGIAVTPRDGMNFSSLYKKADSALYYVKGSGKDNYAFYRDDMAEEHLEPEADSLTELKGEKKRRMLIVDDNEIAHIMLSNIFARDFIIEKARDGNAALIRLRHYGNAISVVLLDLVMPGMDGFTVLRKMRESIEMRNIPVIVVSGDEKRETGLKAIRAGAVDFVNKPFDPDILTLRVQSAISKAENERLRAKNNVLEYHHSEVAKYRSVIENSRITVIEHDWIQNLFTYDTAISSYLDGTYDNRGLWHILLADFVCDTATVKALQQAVHRVAGDRETVCDFLFAKMKTPAKKAHWFKVMINKSSNEFGLTGTIYLTLIDLGEKLPA